MFLMLDRNLFIWGMQRNLFHSIKGYPLDMIRIFGFLDPMFDLVNTFNSF